MWILRSTVLALGLAVTPAGLGAQALDSARREVWRAVEGRWQAWQAGDLERMLSFYHPRFHAWNRLSGGLDAHDAMVTRWRRALESETILAVALKPVAVERYGDFASVFYVSRETVKPLPGAGAAPPDTGQRARPSVVAIRWAEYLVRERGRWLSVGYSGVP